MKCVLLITPPLVQLNAPYPAPPLLAGFLKARGFAVAQADLSLDLVLRLFCAGTLREIERALARRVGGHARGRVAPAVRHFLLHASRYRRTVDAVIRFLQGQEPELAHRIVTRSLLPEGARFGALAELEAAESPFGLLAVADRAKYLASLYLDDLADTIREGIDHHFGFARYGERLAAAHASFAPLARALAGRPSLVARHLDAATDAALARHRPALVGLSVPFPGTLYGALRIAARIRRVAPETRIAMGGGYVNTEWRELSEPALFDLVDYVCLDDGEEPLLRIAGRVCRRRRVALARTFTRASGGSVVFHDSAPGPGEPCGTTAALPDFAALPLQRYISLLEMPNPMHRLWSDGCWLKVPLAHGCYWRRCRFCDTTLDYIARYAPPRPDEVVDRLLALQRATGRSGFHFTDEALAPALLDRLTARLTARGALLAWWGNIRFEAAFTAALAGRMAQAGCVAVSGGLECAHDRLLALMDKGISLRQAARACRALAGAGILVHAYLIYGFPTQTAQETLDGLEFVRQLFAAGALHSAFWHRFALTCHSPMAAAPALYGIRLLPEPRRAPLLARNELAFEEPGAPDHAMLGEGLRRATYNYMLGRGWEEPPANWFARAVPAPTLPADFVGRIKAL